MFRLLGLHPGPDISLSAAASLAGISRAKAGTALRELTRTHMVAEHQPGRFTFHDLLRFYAADQAERHEATQDRHAAVHRVLDHYLHTAMAASQRFSPFRSPLRLPPSAAGRASGRRGRQRAGHVLVRRRGPGAVGADRATPMPTALTSMPGRSPGPSARSSTGAAGGATTRPPRAPRWPPRSASAIPSPSRPHALTCSATPRPTQAITTRPSPNIRRALDLFRELGDRANEGMVLNGQHA